MIKIFVKEDIIQRLVQHGCYRKLISAIDPPSALSQGRH